MRWSDGAKERRRKAKICQFEEEKGRRGEKGNHSFALKENENPEIVLCE